MSAQNLNKNIYPSDELKPLIEPPVIQVSPNAPVLFSYINDSGAHIDIVSIDSNNPGWVSRSGKVINPNTDRPEYIYYMLTKDYQTAYANTVIQMTNDARREDAQARTLAFMQIHRQDLSNSRLGCIQFILILWTVILLAGVAGSLILMHHQGLF